MVFSLTGPSGPPGPQGQQGPKGFKAIADPVKAADIISNQSDFLNSLASSVINNNQKLTQNVSEQILKEPTSISNNLADNRLFQNIIGTNVVNSSQTLGKNIADKMLSNLANINELSSSLGSQGNLLLSLSENLSNPAYPYSNYLKGPSGKIANLDTSLQPIGLLCDQSGNCTTPKFGSYLNYTNGNLLFMNNKGIASFRSTNEGDSWITGFSGGQLGVYDDNTNTGAVNIKWDASGNVIMGNIGETTANLKVGGNVYMKNLYANGFLANQTINIDTIDTDGYSQLFMHGGLAGSHSGGTGTTDGSTFTISKNGPTRNIDGGKNAAVFNNYNNPIIFGDTSTSGNIFLLNNYENYKALSGGNNWINSITGISNITSGNNSAIINNTSTGSFIIVGNSNGTGYDRIVTVKDNLRIGDWNIYESGTSLIFQNLKDDTQTVTLNNGLTTKKGIVNGMTVGNYMLNNINLNNGFNNVAIVNIPDVNSNSDPNINSSCNISSQQFTGNSFVNRGDINYNDKLVSENYSKMNGQIYCGSLRYNGGINSNNINTNNLFTRNIKVNNSIWSGDGENLWFRVPWFQAQGEFYKKTDQPTIGGGK